VDSRSLPHSPVVRHADERHAGRCQCGRYFVAEPKSVGRSAVADVTPLVMSATPQNCDERFDKSPHGFSPWSWRDGNTGNVPSGSAGLGIVAGGSDARRPPGSIDGAAASA
jgi:hypothetical protein